MLGNTLKTIFYYTIMPIFILLAFILLAIASFVSIPWKGRTRFVYWASRIYGAGIVFINPWWRIRIVGKENIEPGKAYVVISNHQSMLDIPLLHTLPFDFRWVSKSEVKQMPLIGWTLRMRNDIYIQRGDSGSAKKMMIKGKDILDAGLCVYIFAEGTRSKDGRIADFKEGAFMLARYAKAEILPVVVDGSWEIVHTGSWRLQHPARITLSIQPPVKPERKSTKDLAEEVRNIIITEHHKLEPQYYTPAQLMTPLIKIEEEEQK